MDFHAGWCENCADESDLLDSYGSCPKCVHLCPECWGKGGWMSIADNAYVDVCSSCGGKGLRR